MTNTASRERMPDRRPNQTRELTWAESDGQATTYTITIGFRLNGTSAEVFCDGAKTGSAMQALLADACVVVSLALQHGIEPSALVHSMAREPVTETETAPASVIGAITEVLMQGSAIEGMDLQMTADRTTAALDLKVAFEPADASPMERIPR